MVADSVQEMTMTNREMLELAAKAVGLPRAAFEHDPENPGLPYWNPLADDGDALRLAVDLGIPVSGLPVGNIAVWARAERCTTVRQAIVRAAAEIGRQAA